MAELENDDIDFNVEENESNNEQVDLQENENFSDEDNELLLRYNIDPETASLDDLKNLAKRLNKAEKTVVANKKAPKKVSSNEDYTKDLELRLFFMENPEFKEDKNWILEILSQEQYKNLTPQDAQVIYKARKPIQSETNRNTVLWGGYKPKPKTIWEYSEKEAMDLNPHDYVKYMKATWMLK